MRLSNCLGSVRCMPDRRFYHPYYDAAALVWREEFAQRSQRALTSNFSLITLPLQKEFPGRHSSLSIGSNLILLLRQAFSKQTCWRWSLVTAISRTEEVAAELIK